MAKKLKVGIIGCGRVAGLLQDDPLRHGVVTHMGAYHAFPHRVVVTCCAARTDDDAQRFSDRFAIPRRYDNYRTMLKKEPLDIVSVCAYADTRAEMIRAAVRAGVKGVFAEKPLATSLCEANSIVRLCKKNAVTLMVNHTRRWAHDYRTVHGMINKKRLGTIQSAVCHFSGALFHTGTHMFDMMNFFFGKPRFVIGRLTEKGRSEWCQIREAEDTFEDFDGTALVGYDNDIIVNVCGTPREYFLFELDIHGSRGRVRIGNQIFEHYVSDASSNYTGFKELQKKPIVPQSFRYPAFEWAVADLIKAVHTGSPVVSSGEDARDALTVALAICESSEKGSVPVLVPLRNNRMRVVAR